MKFLKYSFVSLILFFLAFSAQAEYREPDNPSPTINGLEYSFYDMHMIFQLPEFNDYTPDETGTIGNFVINEVTDEGATFAIKFEGYVDVPTKGVYTFYTNSDDGSKLYIGETEVVDNDGLHKEHEESGTIELDKGKHAITVDFFENYGHEILDVYYSGPGITKKKIPSSVLYRIGEAEEDDDDDTDNTEYLYGECVQPIKSIKGTSNGRVKVTYDDDSQETYDAFNFIGKRKPKVKSYSNSNFIILLAPKSKYVKIMNGCNGVIGDTQKVAKKEQDHGSLKLLDARYDSSLEAVITSTLNKYVKLSLIRINIDDKTFGKKAKKRFYSEENIAARKTKRRKRGGVHKIVVRNADAETIKSFKVTKKYNLKSSTNS
ncbi:MAG: PA14 domain-containing protein [Patescibacteria group bacterium]